MDDTENVANRIEYLADIHLVLIPKNGNHPHCTTGTVVKRTDFHEDGSASVYKYVELEDLAFEVITGRSKLVKSPGGGMAQDK